MKKLLNCLVIFSLITLAGCQGKGITVPVEAGEYASIEIPNFTIPGKISFQLSIDELNSEGTQWAPNIYFSLYENSGEDRFALSLSQNDFGEALLATADHYKEGEVVFRKGLIYSIPLGAKVSFSLSWSSDGSIKYSIEGREPVNIQTHLRDFKARVHISSATATFYPE